MAGNGVVEPTRKSTESSFGRTGATSFIPEEHSACDDWTEIPPLPGLGHCHIASDPKTPPEDKGAILPSPSNLDNFLGNSTFHEDPTLPVGRI